MKQKRKNTKKLNRVISLLGVFAVLYFVLSGYDHMILYLDYTGYWIYGPVIAAGLFLFRNFKGDYDHFFVNWFFRFVMSVMFCYVPAMGIFLLSNSIYIKDKPIKSLTSPLEKAISGKNAHLLIKINGETQSIYGYSKQLDDMGQTKPSDYSVLLKYKEGLFGTYHIEDYSVYRINYD